MKWNVRADQNGRPTCDQKEGADLYSPQDNFTTCIRFKYYLTRMHKECMEIILIGPTLAVVAIIQLSWLYQFWLVPEAISRDSSVNRQLSGRVILEHGIQE